MCYFFQLTVLQTHAKFVNYMYICHSSYTVPFSISLQWAVGCLSFFERNEKEGWTTEIQMGDVLFSSILEVRVLEIQ